MNAIQTLGDAVSKLGKRIHDLEREVSGRKSHASRLSMELKQSENQREQLKLDLEALRQSFDSAVASDNLRCDIISRLEASNNALSQENNQRQAREQELNTIVTALQAELKNLNDEIKALSFTVEKRNEAIESAIHAIEFIPPIAAGDPVQISAEMQDRLLAILKQGAQK